MALKNYKTSELYGELMRRGEGTARSEWALHVAALSRAMRLLYHCVGTSGGYAAKEYGKIQMMLGDGFNNGLVREAELVLAEIGED